MKFVNLLFCAILLGAGGASGQTSPGVSVPPDIVVLQKNWRLDARNSSLDEDPFTANAEFNDAQRAQRDNDIQNASRAKGSESREPPPLRTGKSKDSSLTLTAGTTYLYQVKIKNTGTKTIRSVDWVYTFVDPETQRELGRHRYSNKIKIRPDQNNMLVGRTASPPTYVVNVKNSGKDVGKQLSEQVVISRIEYEDGSVWQNPTK